jgi:hypothetical protein
VPRTGAPAIAAALPPAPHVRANFPKLMSISPLPVHTAEGDLLRDPPPPSSLSERLARPDLDVRFDWGDLHRPDLLKGVATEHVVLKPLGSGVEVMPTAFS